MIGILRAPRASTGSRLIRSSVIGVVCLAVLVLAWRHYGTSQQIAPVSWSVWPVIMALAGGGLFLVGRAWRIHSMFGGRAPMLPLLGQTGVSWGAGLLLPGPSADAALVVLARRLGIGMRRGTSVALIGRILDVISLAVIMVVASAFDGVDEPAYPIVISALIGAACLAMLVVAMNPTGRRLILRLISRVGRLRPYVGAADDAMEELSHRRQIAVMVGATVLCRVATLLQYGALFMLVGAHLGVWSVWFVLALRTFLSTIPIQGVAGLGTGQLWWTSGLVVAGVSAGQAIGMSITVSLLDLAMSAPLVLVCLWLMRAMSKRARENSGELTGAAPTEQAQLV